MKNYSTRTFNIPGSGVSRPPPKTTNMDYFPPTNMDHIREKGMRPSRAAMAGERQGIYQKW